MIAITVEFDAQHPDINIDDWKITSTPCGTNKPEDIHLQGVS